MPRPHREVPSQRLPVPVLTHPGVAVSQRSVWWVVGITLLGWVLLSYPVILLAILSFIVMTGALGSAVTAAGVALGIVGLLSALAMAAFPLLLGQAVKSRRRDLWIAALLTGALTIAACIYLVVEWVLPLG